MKLICVVMKDENPNYYEDTIALFDYGFSNFQRMNISQTETKYNIDNVGAFTWQRYLRKFQTDSAIEPKRQYYPAQHDYVPGCCVRNLLRQCAGQAAAITYTYNDVGTGNGIHRFHGFGKRKQVFGGRDRSDAGTRTAPGLRSRQLPGKKIQSPAVRR